MIGDAVRDVLDPETRADEPTPLLIADLIVEFGPPGSADARGRRRRLRHRAGECVGIVGESGSGKSMTSLAILRLIPEPPGRIAAGRIHFEGRDLLDAAARRMRGHPRQGHRA